MSPSTRSFAWLLVVFTLFSPVGAAAQSHHTRHRGDHPAPERTGGLLGGGAPRILLSVDFASADIPGEWTTASCGNARDTVFPTLPFWKYPSTTTRDGSIRARNIVWGDIIAWSDNIVWGDSDDVARASALLSSRANGEERR